MHIILKYVKHDNCTEIKKKNCKMNEKSSQ